MGAHTLWTNTSFQQRYHAAKVADGLALGLFARRVFARQQAPAQCSRFLTAERVVTCQFRLVRSCHSAIQSF